MTPERDVATNPLTNRYASAEMSYLFSDEKKFRTWRRIWIALAESEQELGLSISTEQIEEMRLHANEINYLDAEKKEREIRHDVMSHVYAYGLQCELAKPIMHLGATSCTIGDNADLIILREALELVRAKIAAVLRNQAGFAAQYKALPTLGFTHYQPAQLTTVGKRAALWMQDLLIDFKEIDRLIEWLPFRGVKGTTGTQASFLELFNGDHAKVKALDKRVSEKLGFANPLPVTGQTYTRKIDSILLNALSGVAQSLHKFANDIRLLMNLKEIEEPFEKSQVGSSAMAYKRNPMRSERLTGLCRYLMTLPQNPAFTAASQWLERTLDDSANRRLALSEAFLAADACLILAANITKGMVVYPEMIKRRLREELPFMATENILMAAVKAGGDRQELHERIREHSFAAAKVVKEQGGQNDLIERLQKDPAFAAVKDKMGELLDPSKFTGRAAEQTEEFLTSEITPILERFKETGTTGEVRV